MSNENYVTQFINALPPENKPKWFEPMDRESKAAMNLVDTKELITFEVRESLHKA